MVTYSILASLALAVTAARPRAWWSTTVVVAAAAVAAALGAGTLRAALSATAPTVVFLIVAVAIATVAVRLGLAVRLADSFERAALGSEAALYVVVCLATALATAFVSLDGAVVLLVPVVIELARRGASLRPLLLGSVAVANAFSLGLPEGNPTNLVVLERMGDGFGAYTARALPAGLAAAVVCAAGVAVLARGAPLHSSAPVRVRLAAGLGAVVRLGLQLSALLVLLLPISRRLPVPEAHGLLESLAVAGATAGAAALVNNLPASAVVAVLLSGPAAYAALAGLSVGALATEHGSVATLLAGELAGTRAYERWIAVVAVVALTVATALLYSSSGM